MNTRVLLTISAMLVTANLPAQTADDWVAQGRAFLPTNLVSANARFVAALNVSPNHPDANALAAATRLLLLPQQTAGSNFLNRLGVSRAGRDLFNWTADLTRDTNGDVILPPNLNSSEGISLYKTTVMPAISASLTNLARITNTGFLLTLTATETSIDTVTLDYGDILMLRALLHMADFAGHTLNAHNFSVVINHLRDLGDADQLTIQRMLADYPSLLGQVSKNELNVSKVGFTNAIIYYLQASDFIRNQRLPDEVRLFNLSTNDVADEAEFRDQLAKALESLDHPVRFSPEDGFSIYGGSYFSGAKSLRSLLPRFEGDLYINNSLPDYTLGGFLVDLPPCDTESFLREKLGNAYAGIYVGNGNMGDFAVIIRTNLQATVVGYDFVNESGIFAEFKVDDDGYWEFNTNGVWGWGQVYSDGWLEGEVVYNPFGWSWIQGERQPASGPLQKEAGYYGGTWSGGGSSGKLQAIMTPNGQVFFCKFDSSGAFGDGGWGEVDFNNHFEGSSVNSMDVAGTLNRATLTLAGGFTNVDATGTFTLSRRAFVPFDLPPAITSPLQSKTVNLGTNVTFSVAAAGSAPLCYQWYSNEVAIPKATSSTLVLTNVQYESSAYYSVSVRNVVGETNSTARLTVVAQAPTTFSLPDYYHPVHLQNEWVYISWDQPGDYWTTTCRVVAADSPITIYTNCSPPQSRTRNVVSVLFDQGNGDGLWTNHFMISNDTWGYVGFDHIYEAPLRFGPGFVFTNRFALGQAVSKTSTIYSNGVCAGQGTFSVQLVNLQDVHVPAGDFLECLHLKMTYTIGAKSRVDEGWWAKGVGPVVWTHSGGGDSETNILSRFSFVSAPRITAPPRNLTNSLGSTVSFRVEAIGDEPRGYQWRKDGVVLVDSPNLSGATSTNLVLTDLQFQDAGGYSVTVSNAYGMVTSAPPALLTVLDLIPPSLNVSSHSEAQLVGVNVITLTGTASDAGRGDNGIASVTVNGLRATNDTATADAPAYWSRSVSLVLGTNRLTVVAKDGRGNASTNIIRIVSDSSRPVLTIQTPLNGARLLTNSGWVTVRGVTSDNRKTAAVWFQLNTGGWTNANTANFWTNWNTAVPMQVGTNMVRAYAEDEAGNRSVTNSVSFQYVVTSPVTLQLVGKGSVVGLTNGQQLEVGKSYSMTATAGAGYAFSNWYGGTEFPLPWLTNGNSVRFVMQSNLTLQANFFDVTKPTLTITTPTASQRMSNSVTSVRGTAIDNARVAAVMYQLNGNAWTLASSGNGFTNWITMLGLTKGTNVVRAYALDDAGNRSLTNSVSFISSNSFTLRLTVNPPPSTTAAPQLGVEVTPGMHFRIEVSTDLLQWTTLTNFNSPNGVMYFADPGVANMPVRFYRGVTP